MSVARGAAGTALRKATTKASRPPHSTSTTTTPPPSTQHPSHLQLVRVGAHLGLELPDLARGGGGDDPPCEPVAADDLRDLDVCVLCMLYCVCLNLVL